ncbi:M60 family metallopeptidase [Chitinophaga sp. sic0106]|uniref:M60 family metallopeptidase n=1 Tax=Chitinophaga sp. sic0106 TaxID=2854785 RepID=UPI001C47CCD1|nr:M60 family metallopeptidase [Chitinophaga sp. sic0106]MBV7532076.1 M60 family metallopeptidase [Chitinophaga sp. sic0106]
MKNYYVLTVALLLPTVSLASVPPSDTTRNDPSQLEIRKDQPLGKQDTALRKAVISWSRTTLENTDYKTIQAHPSSRYFPGEVKPGTPTIKKVISIRHQRPADSTWRILRRMNGYPDTYTQYSTGLYAPAGQVIEIQLPQHLADMGELFVQIGCHTDNLGQWNAGRSSWVRMPDIVKYAPLDKAVVRVNSPFGGLIYIKCRPTVKDWSADIRISGAVSSPLYIRGVTTDEQWQAQLKSSGAPWGEIATDRIILSVPDSILQKLSNPKKVMDLWDAIIGAEMDLGQYPQPVYRPMRLAVDVQISGGFMHNGYPIMAHCDEGTLNTIANPDRLLLPSSGGSNWGYFHEIGHNLQNPDWIIAGTGEVSCNFFALYCFDRLIGDRHGAHGEMTAEKRKARIQQYFAAGPDYAKWKQDPFLALTMFWQIQEAFGWEAFKAFIRRYQENLVTDPNASFAKNEDSKRDRFVQTFSEVTGRNLVPFFKAWGFPLGTKLEKEMRVYPEWMPYNMKFDVAH